MLKSRITNEVFLISILSLIIIFPYLFLIGLKKELILGSSSGDIIDFFVIIRNFGFGLLSKGIIPLWNPYIFSGVPLLAESQLAIFYPFNLIHLFLPLPLAINFLIVLHQVMAGIFMYIYLKRLTLDSFSCFVGASVFALSSAFITRVFSGHLTVLCVIAWLPLLFFLIDKSLSKEGYIFNILTGFVLSLQVFAGHIQFVFITLVALFLYVADVSLYNYKDNHSIKKTLYPFYIFLSSTILGIGLSSIQLLPLIELTKESIRYNNPVWSYPFSMPPENIVTILIPGFFGWINKALYWGKWYPWEVSLYVGILPLFLAFFAIIKGGRYSRFFTGLLLLSFILSLGAYLPIYRYLFRYMIGFNMFRANGRFLILGIFSLSVLASLGCRNLKDYYISNETDRKLIFTIIFGFILFLILFSARLILSYFPSFWNRVYSFIVSYDKLSAQTGFNFGCLFSPDFVKKIAILSLNNSILFVLLGILLFIFYVKRTLKENLMKFLVALFIISDLLSFGCNYFAYSTIKDCHLDNKAVNFLKSNIGKSRYLPLGALTRNAGMMDKIPSIGGYSGCVPRRYNEFINFTQGRPLDIPFVIDSIRRPSRLFALLNLKYILVNGDMKSDFSHFEKVYYDDDVTIYQTPISLPKAFIVHKAKFISNRDDILNALSDEAFDFKDTVILEENFKLNKEGSTTIIEPEPVITTYSPNRVVVKADVRADGFLVLCDNYFPGWRAYVDRKKVHILKADYILRAVYLPAGIHTVEFLYSPASLKIGLFITLSFLIFSSVTLANRIVKNKFKGGIK
ncbi:MAG: YfhO family protein [Candidatus Omnitrophota bacterium]